MTRLGSARRLAAFAIGWERLWPLALPVLGVVALFLIVSWFGIWPMLPDIGRWALVGAFALGFIASLLPLRNFRWPDSGTIDTRVEILSKLQNRPITAQADSQADVAGGRDPFAKALWQEHQKRMADSLGNLKSGTPSPKVASSDPWALRAVVALLLFVAVFAGYGNLTGHVQDAFRSHVAQAAVTGRIDAWIKPPAYTNKPPLFLSRAGGGGSVVEGTVTVPEGSELVIRVLDLDNPVVKLKTPAGENDIPVFVPEDQEPTETKKSASNTYKAKLTESGSAALQSGNKEMANWAFIVTPDEDPTIAFLEDPKPSLRGALEFSYEVEDDYGVAFATADIKPLAKAAEGARALIEAPDIPLTLPGRRKKNASAKTSKDLSSHPWAGAEVEITLLAQDDAGQKAQSETRKLKLPGRVFTKPLARALVFERRRLAMDANQQRDVAEMLNIITTTHPEIFIKNLSHYTALRVAYRHIKRAKTDDHLRDGLEQLWQLALAVEDGDLSLAQQRLRDAQERLAEALERGASDEEIEKLMEELRQAMNEFMRELAEQFAKNPQNQQAQQQNQNMQNLRQQDIDRMMQRIEDLAKSGSKDAARELLRQLQEMMNNLQMAQPQQNQQQNDQFSEQMNKLGDMMRQQQELMDQTFDMQRRQQQQQQQQGQQQQQQQGQQNQQQQGQQGEQQQQGQKPMTAEEFAEAMKQLQEQQGRLQEQMQQMQKEMEGMGMNPGEKMNEAGEAMGQAEGNLGEGDTGQATGNQGRALQAMREGAQQMMQQMQNQAGEQGQRGQRGQHGEQTRQDADPLGRQSRSRGPQLGDDTKIPGEIDAQRAREILEAIRKRLGEAARPKLELEYLDRLLPSR